MARPSEYNEEILEKAKHYLVNHLAEYEDLVPSVAGLAVALGKHRDTMYDWASHEDKAEFSDTLKLIDTKQHQALLNGGLSGDMTANIVKLMLHNHGYSDKQESTLQGPRGGPIEMDSNHFLFEGVNEDSDDQD